MSPGQSPNPNPASWIEMGLQGQSLTLNVLMENQEVMLVTQNLTLLAQIVSEGMRRVMEAYNSHLWMLISLQPSMNYQI